MLVDLNDNALNDPRVHVHNTDALRFVETSRDFYDVVLIDLPDPSTPEIGKLYAQAFYGLIGRRLAAGGVMACQCTSPFRSRAAYWCIVHTIERTTWGPGEQQRFRVQPYHTLVPTFGTWGFVLAGAELPAIAGIRIEAPADYLTADVLPGLFVFPPDMARVDTPVNRLDDPVVTRLYREGYHKYLE